MNQHQLLPTMLQEVLWRAAASRWARLGLVTFAVTSRGVDRPAHLLERRKPLISASDRLWRHGSCVPAGVLITDRQQASLYYVFGELFHTEAKIQIFFCFACSFTRDVRVCACVCGCAYVWGVRSCICVYVICVRASVIWVRGGIERREETKEQQHTDKNIFHDPTHSFCGWICCF